MEGYFMFPKGFEPRDLFYLNKMVTPGFMTLIYWIICGLSILCALAYIISNFSLVGLIGGLVLLVVGLLYIRVLCEILVVIFKINSNLQKIADKE